MTGKDECIKLQLRYCSDSEMRIVPCKEGSRCSSQFDFERWRWDEEEVGRKSRIYFCRLREQAWNRDSVARGSMRDRIASRHCFHLKFGGCCTP